MPTILPQIIISERASEQVSMELDTRGIQHSTKFNQELQVTMVGIQASVAESVMDLLSSLGFAVEGILHYQQKSMHQKPDCINGSEGDRCPNPSTLQAAFNDQFVRCCRNAECMQNAGKRAITTALRP